MMVRLPIPTVLLLEIPILISPMVLQTIFHGKIYHSHLCSKVLRETISLMETCKTLHWEISEISLAMPITHVGQQLITRMPDGRTLLPAIIVLILSVIVMSKMVLILNSRTSAFHTSGIILFPV